ncbi:MAG: ATP-binding cassette domain-containing protein [Lachnospiraceae bacterium]|nr:ATP-binding cassette domain-containing protein [Lachnospiraceae bacterium]
MLSIKNLSFNYGKKQFGISDISLKLDRGRFTVLFGEKGAGKTTLLKNMGLLLRPDKGEILWEGEKINIKQPQLYKKVIAYIDETGWGRESFSLDENVNLFEHFYDNFDRNAFDNYMTIFGLDGAIRQEYYKNIDEKQKIQFQVAFALARKPKFLFLDEPLAKFNVVEVKVLMEEIHKKMRTEDMGVVMSTHLEEEIPDFAEYVVVMENGSVAKFGTRKAVMPEKSILNSIPKEEYKDMSFLRF